MPMNTNIDPMMKSMIKSFPHKNFQPTFTNFCHLLWHFQVFQVSKWTYATPDSAVTYLIHAQIP